MGRIDVKWQPRFVALADLAASWSKDPSTKVGAVIVDPVSLAILSTGYNGFPRRVREHMVDDPDALDEVRWTRPEKYRWVEHAERNAIYNAARLGARTEGMVMFVNWEPTPCADCARAIIQAGITAVYGPTRPFSGVGKGTHYLLCLGMLEEAGVEVHYVHLK